MAAVAKERPRVTSGPDSAELTYLVRDDAGGSLTASAARVAALAAAPSTFDGLTRYDSECEIRELATDRFDVVVPYGAGLVVTAALAPLQTGEAEYQFNTTLESVRIYTSLQTTASYFDPSVETSAYNFQQSINVDADGRVQGTTIQVPVSRFKYRYRLSNTTVTLAYQTALEELAGQVNGAIFLGRAAGSVRFDGATGGKKTHGDWELEFNFTRRPNVSNLTIGNITGISADGWDFLWPYFLSTEAAGRGFTAPTPVYLYRERIYPRGDFSVLQLPT